MHERAKQRQPQSQMPLSLTIRTKVLCQTLLLSNLGLITMDGILYEHYLGGAYKIEKQFFLYKIINVTNCFMHI